MTLSEHSRVNSMCASVPLLAASSLTLSASRPLPRRSHLSSANGDLLSPGLSGQQTGSLVAGVERDGVNSFFIAARVDGPAVTLFQRTVDG